jgi:hypothetical protein
MGAVTRVYVVAMTKRYLQKRLLQLPFLFFIDVKERGNKKAGRNCTGYNPIWQNDIADQSA